MPVAWLAFLITFCYYKCLSVQCTVWLNTTPTIFCSVLQIETADGQFFFISPNALHRSFYLHLLSCQFRMFGDNSWHAFCLQVVTFPSEMTSLRGVLCPGSCLFCLWTPPRTPAPKPPGPWGHSARLPRGSFWSSPRAGSAPCFPHRMGPCACWMLYHCCVLPCFLMIIFSQAPLENF